MMNVHRKPFGRSQPGLGDIFQSHSHRPAVASVVLMSEIKKEKNGDQSDDDGEMACVHCGQAFGQQDKD